MTSVLHLSTSDISGGAAISAHRLHSGLRQIGVDSRMLVRSKTSSDPNVSEFLNQKSFLDRAKRLVTSQRLNLERRPYERTLSPTLELFSDDRVPGPQPLFPPLPEVDVLNLHWVAGFVDYRRLFGRLPLYFPLVWTLHDMAPFTGGCHYTLGCASFTANCGRCPQLGSTQANDLSSQIHDRKKISVSAAARETIRIVAPSTWLADEARRSSIFGNMDTLVIPYGVNVDIFKPTDKRTAREALGLPHDQKIVLFAADGVTNHRKGYDLLLEALGQFQGSTAPLLVSLGRGAAPTMATNVCALGHISSQRIMALAINAADVFILPTRADNLPNVVLEAMACGVPVVTFNVGGLPDMVRPGLTGFLAPPEDVGALGSAIRMILDDDDLRARMSAECRSIATSKFTLELQASRYKELYEELIEASGSKLRGSA